ncbi:MAG: hypothetical protein AAF570_23775 [Bacteroidota bacterium]
MSNADSTAAPRRRKWTFYLGYIFFLLVILLIAGEVTVRFMGYSAWAPADQKFEVVGGGSLFAPDSLLGYRGRPGVHDALLDGKLKFRVTQDAEGWRITEPIGANQADSIPRPEVWIFGCSFTHGYGVEDNVTYPWLLQSAFPSYKVRNFGMSAYGTLQSDLLLADLLAKRPKAGRSPALVVLAYGGFHDQRNTSNRYWRKVLSGREVSNGLRYPHVRFDDSDSLVLGYSELEYAEFPLMRVSALSHFVEMKYNRGEDTKLRSAEVTERLIGRMEARCKAKQVPFLLTGVFYHSDTERMLGRFGERGTDTLDISVDMEAHPEMKILPEDGHPNAEGHAKMGEKLEQWMRANLVVEEIPVDSGNLVPAEQFP